MDENNTDDLFIRVLGPNLQMATFRLIGGLALLSAIIAALGLVIR